VKTISSPCTVTTSLAVPANPRSCGIRNRTWVPLSAYSESFRIETAYVTACPGAISPGADSAATTERGQRNDAPVPGRTGMMGSACGQALALSRIAKILIAIAALWHVVSFRCNLQRAASTHGSCSTTPTRPSALVDEGWRSNRSMPSETLCGKQAAHRVDRTNDRVY
jgi:hypothetical protein